MAKSRKDSKGRVLRKGRLFAVMVCISTLTMTSLESDSTYMQKI